MSTQSRAGATCLVLAPLFGVASMLIERTVSLKAADQVAAFTAHPGLTHLGLAFNAIAAVLLIAGVVWFAWVTYEQSPRLAFAGGVLGVVGLLAILFDDAVHVAGSLMVAGLGTTQATDGFHRVISGGSAAVGPLSELADIGIILLAVAALKISLPRWAAALVAAGGVVQGLGFATGNRYVAAAGFAASFVGFAMVVRTALATEPEPAPVPPAMAIQHA
jgi:hypothetical protein